MATRTTSAWTSRWCCPSCRRARRRWRTSPGWRTSARPACIGWRCSSMRATPTCSAWCRTPCRVTSTRADPDARPWRRAGPAVIGLQHLTLRLGGFEERAMTRHANASRAGAWDDAACLALIDTLWALRQSLLDQQARLAPRLRAVDPAHQASAINLVHYLALRRIDLRQLQDGLARMGVSSL